MVVEDDNSVRNTIQTFLELEGYTVDAVSSTREALERLRDDAYPIVISDIYIDERTGLDVLETARKKNPQCAVILMTARGTIETVMKATQGGAFDYIAKPFELDRMLDTVKRAEASVGQHHDDKDSEIEDLPESEMIGSSPSMIEIYKTVSLVAPTNATVLLEGETGTGKEMIARMIHNNSSRAQSAVRAGGLRVHCAVAAGERVVRSAERRLHRRRPRSHRRLRSRQQRHCVSG